MHHFIAMGIALALAQPALGFAQHPPPATATTDRAQSVLPSRVPLVRLLANPEAYDGQRVAVSGFLHAKFEDSALYLTKDDADYLTENAIWVSYSSTCTFVPLSTSGKESGRATEANLDGRYVELIGVFNANNNGHMGMFAGAIEQVRNASESPQLYDGRNELRKGRDH
jgi:hypothetical protein